MKSPIVVIILAVCSLFLACCCCGSGLGNFNWEEWAPLLTPAPPEPTPNIVRETPPADVGETEAQLATVEIPMSDLHELAIRLQGVPADTPRTINPEGSPDYAVGTRRLFHVSNTDTDEQFDIYATLEYKTDHVYMWVEEGQRFDQDNVVAAAETFEDTYTTERSFFGSEWSPGVDNDPRISILSTTNMGYNTLGYFSTPDEFVTAVRSDSNEMEMFYLNLDNMEINDSQYNATLAHEFQHMIHFYNDRNEAMWLNEGFSELASFLSGMGAEGHEYSYAGQPDNQLTDIDYDAPNYSASYGGAYLFTAYFLGRYGAEATQDLVSLPENGLASVDIALDDLNTGLTADDFFADWVIANLLQNPDIYGGKYDYQGFDPPGNFDVGTRFSSSDYPVDRETTVAQYGVDYIEMEGDQPLTFSFTGSTQVGLINTQAHSGDYLWWSNRADVSDMTLTREFDLSDVRTATLEFWTWYDLEEDWDYAYVEVSADGGETWEILTTPSCTVTNPNSNSYGCGYTGKSGGGSDPEWLQEEADLSPYTGQTVLVRFEYITDAAVNKPGLAVDDVTIPEIDYSTDFEAEDDSWVPAGFIRFNNVLAQNWIVQLVLYGPETTVERLALEPNQTGEWEIPLSASTDRAVIAVSAVAPVTTEVASYGYGIAEH